MFWVLSSQIKKNSYYEIKEVLPFDVTNDP